MILKSYRFFVFFLISILSQNLFALDFNIKGKIYSLEGKPLANAKVTILELSQSVTTDNDGSFMFEHVASGSYTISASSLRHKSDTQKITLKDKDEYVEFTLLKTNLEMSEINVTAKSYASEMLVAPQSVNVIEGRQLKKQRGENIMSSLNNTPGVSTLSTGSGTSKPVIRGLTGQRVLVLTDGVRQEEQQFGDDHTVNLDALDVEKIEVVKGPASVLYGSDALGGVVNIIRSKAPTSKDNSKKLSGQITTNSFSNNKQDAEAISLFGNTNGFGYKVSSNTRKAGQIYTPNGRLPNTGFSEENKSASISSDGKWGNMYLDSFKRDQVQDVYNNPNELLQGGKAFRKTSHEKTHLHTFFIFSLFNLEIDAGYQRNNTREIPDKNIFAPIQNTLFSDTESNFTKGYEIYQVTGKREKQGLNIFLDTGTLDVKVHHKPFAGLKGTVGVSGMQQRNATIGTEPLIPAYNLVNYAGFIYEQYSIGDLTFSAGIRSDKRGVDIQSNPTLGNSEQSKIFSASTGTAGAVWRIAKPFAIAINAGKGFRAPTVFELLANGVHEGTGRFENGNKNLKPETSHNADLSFRYATSKIQGELSIFQNNFKNYIYSVSTGQIDHDSGLPVYKYKQDKAIINGGEFSLQAEITKWLVLQGGIDLLRGTVKKTFETTNLTPNSLTVLDRIYDDLYSKHGHALPRMTPNRSRLGLRLTKEKFFLLDNPYLSLNAKFVDAQYRVDKLETKTGSYNLYDLGFGFELPGLGKEAEKATLDFAVHNIFNKAYVDNLSRYKDYALAPGINFTFKLTVPFTIIN